MQNKLYSQVGDFYFSIIEPVFGKISFADPTEVFLYKFLRLIEVERNLFATHFCYAQIVNGGLNQFFWNSTGIVAPESALGFRAIGFKRCAEIIEEAISFFDKPYSRDCAYRRENLARIEKKLGNLDPFSSMDDEFYDSLCLTDFLFEKLADKYAEENTINI